MDSVSISVAEHPTWLPPPSLLFRFLLVPQDWNSPWYFRSAFKGLDTPTFKCPYFCRWYQTGSLLLSSGYFTLLLVSVWGRQNIQVFNIWMLIHLLWMCTQDMHVPPMHCRSSFALFFVLDNCVAEPTFPQYSLRVGVCVGSAHLHCTPPAGFLRLHGASEKGTPAFIECLHAKSAAARLPLHWFQTGAWCLWQDTATRKECVGNSTKPKHPASF